MQGQLAASSLPLSLHSTKFKVLAILRSITLPPPQHSSNHLPLLQQWGSPREGWARDTHLSGDAPHTRPLSWRLTAIATPQREAEAGWRHYY